MKSYKHEENGIKRFRKEKYLKGFSEFRPSYLRSGRPPDLVEAKKKYQQIHNNSQLADGRGIKPTKKWEMKNNVPMIV